VHAPQLSVPPHPSETDPQFAPWAVHVVGTHASTAREPELPPEDAEVAPPEDELFGETLASIPGPVAIGFVFAEELL
jgi:hypothetical protein